MPASRFLNAAQLEKFNYLRDIEDAVVTQLKKGGLLYGKKGNREMSRFLADLFKVLVAMTEGSVDPPHPFVCVFDKAVESFDFAVCDDATQTLNDVDNFAVFAAATTNFDESVVFKLVFG